MTYEMPGSVGVAGVGLGKELSSPHPSPFSQRLAGLMELAVIPKSSYTVPNPHGMSWWKLTEQGARVVAYWIGQGFTSKTLENGDLPSKVIPRLIR